MEHKLPELPFAIDALAPHYSRETLEYHHGKHHQAYVTKLNELLALPENAQWQGKSLEDIVMGSSGVMFNQAAQIWNHTFYWNGLRPNPDSKPNPPPRVGSARCPAAVLGSGGGRDWTF